MRDPSGAPSGPDRRGAGRAFPPVPWEPGDRWLLPGHLQPGPGKAATVVIDLAALSDPGDPPVGPAPAPVPARYTIAYLPLLDEPSLAALRQGAGAPRPAGREPGGVGPAGIPVNPPPAGSGAPPAEQAATGGPPLPPRSVGASWPAGRPPVVVLAILQPEVVAAVWGTGVQGVVARDPDHLRALLQAAAAGSGPDGHTRAGGGAGPGSGDGRRAGTRWVLLPWPEEGHPGLWARGWARVVEWTPGAVGPVLVPRRALAVATAGTAVAGGEARGGGTPAPAPSAGTGEPTGPSCWPGRGRDGQQGFGLLRWLQELARARTELLRHLEEFVPVPVVVPIALAPADPDQREAAGLAGVPVWWLWSGGGCGKP